MRCSAFINDSDQEEILRNSADSMKLERAVGSLGGGEILINVRAGQSPTVWSLTRTSANSAPEAWQELDGETDGRMRKAVT